MSKEEIIKELLTLLEKANYTVYTSVKRVSRSGMFRVIDCFVIIENNPIHINWHIDQLGLFKRDKQEDGLRVSGCGSDMGFEIVYNLSSMLFRDNFICVGVGCPSNDHVNGDKDYTPHKHSDAGYRLIQKWL